MEKSLTKQELHEKLKAQQTRQKELLELIRKERREQEAIFYNLDGRHFFMVFEGEKLYLLKVHFSAEAEILRSVPMLLLFVPVALLFKYLFGWELTFWHFVAFIAIQVVVSWLFDTAFARSNFYFARKNAPPFVYEFDRARNTATIGYFKSFPLEQIVAINATKKSKTRFLIVLELRDGTSISLGDWCFASKEFSWRLHATKIAEFLRVPLRIPAI